MAYSKLMGKKTEPVPTNVLADRLDELSEAVTKGQEGIDKEFYMSIPAKHDYDADLVLSESANRLRELKSSIKPDLRFVERTIPSTELGENQWKTVKILQFRILLRINKKLIWSDWEDIPLVRE